MFFSATFSACGSGSLERITVLRYVAGDGSRIVNLMPYVAVSNVSDRAMWSVSAVSSYPLYVQADFEWHGNEPHFGAHFFDVEVWALRSSEVDICACPCVIEQRSATTGETAGHVRVLVPEQAEILRRLGAK